MSHKRLSQYTVVAGGKSSRIVEFSKGEAEVYVRNFIESRLSHSYIKQVGALKDLKGYFSDTNLIKNQLSGQIEKVKSGITNALADLDTATLLPSGSADDKTISGVLTGLGINVQELELDEVQTKAGKINEKLNEALEKLGNAQKNIKKVLDDSDFNKENIDEAKDGTYGILSELVEQGITKLSCATKDDSGAITNHTVPYDEDGENQNIDLVKENRKFSGRLNKLRKWQFDIFEEEYSAEIYVGSYHEYKYTKTLEELCDVLNTAIKSLGAEIDLKAEKYHVKDTEVMREPDTEAGESEPVNIEEDIKNALTAKDIKYKRIDIDWHDKDYDPGADDEFAYSYQ